MALIGDTVRLRVRFRTFNGNAVDPTNVKLRVLDGNDYAEIDVIPMTDTDKVDVGVYEHDYVIPDGDSETLVYEFSGMFNGKPILSRGSFNRAFI